jgi:glycopeptide antibiotics resistance protein
MTPSPLAEERQADLGGRRVLAVLFAVYLVLLVWLVMWKFEAPWVADGSGRSLKLVPYVATTAAGGSALREVIENIAIFIPFGVYLGLLAPKWRWWGALGVIAGTSVLVEIAQYVLAAGRSDITDVTDNALGGLLGIVLVIVLRRRAGALGTLTRICLVGTVVAAVAAGLFIASPIRLGPHDHGQIVRRSTSSDDRRAMLHQGE